MQEESHCFCTLFPPPTPSQVTHKLCMYEDWNKYRGTPQLRSSLGIFQRLHLSALQLEVYFYTPHSKMNRLWRYTTLSVLQLREVSRNQFTGIEKKKLRVLSIPPHATLLYTHWPTSAIWGNCVTGRIHWPIFLLLTLKTKLVFTTNWHPELILSDKLFPWHMQSDQAV